MIVYMLFFLQCKLIIAQMSNTRCELISRLLVPLFSIVMIVIFLDLGVLEFYILSGYSLFVTVSHIHFGVSVVRKCSFSSANLSTYVIGSDLWTYPKLIVMKV